MTRKFILHVHTKGKLSKKTRKDDIQSVEKNPDYCDSQTHNVIRQYFEKSSSYEINL